MKVYFEVVDTSDANAALSVDNIEIQLDRNWHRLEKLAHLVRGFVPARVAANTIGVWLNWPGEVQGVRFTNQVSAVVTATMDIIDGSNEQMYRNFNDVTVNEFQGGKSYLIPFTAKAVTGIMPQTGITGIENTADSVFVPTHYPYHCASTHQVRTGQSFIGTLFEIDLESTVKIAHESMRKENTQSVKFVRTNVG